MDDNLQKTEYELFSPEGEGAEEDKAPYAPRRKRTPRSRLSTEKREAREGPAPERAAAPKSTARGKGVAASAGIAQLPQRLWTELRQEWRAFCLFLEAFFIRWGKNFRRGTDALGNIVTSKRNKGFPESTHFLVQLMLLIWGMLPYQIGRLRERVLHRRKRRMGVSARLLHIEENLRLHPALFLGTAGLLACFVIFFSIFSFCSRVSYEGKELGYVSSAADVKTACSNIENATKQTLDRRYSIDQSAVETHLTLTKRRNVQNETEFENALSAEIGLVSYGYGLYIDDQLVCATPYQYVLDDLLEQMKYAYTTENTVSCEFEEKVEVREGYATTDLVMDVGKIAELLNGTHEEEVTYTVKKGDVWSKIANSHDMTTAELLKLNPGYNVNSLHIGDTLILSAAVPYLTTTFTEQQHYIDQVPYQIEYQQNDNMYKGDYKVLSAGVYGSADVLADVTYTNGAEVGRQVRSSVTLVQPVTEIQAVGTKERPTWMPTGNFRWPCSGHITSYFGYRTLWGRSNYHGGLDIANKKGTAIYAADGGTVSYAGWYSTYGYMIIVNHGNGYETYYAHCSKLLVSTGDHVYKGQQIAKMGSTGNASGSHCHFEVRYNGARRNPTKYLP